MSESLVTQFGAPDALYCDTETARITIIPAPLEYSVYSMKGIEHGPQAILDASSQIDLYDSQLCPMDMEGQACADFLAAKLVYKMIGYHFYDEP